MPIFEYQCPECHGVIEMWDTDPECRCPNCKETMARVLSATPGYVTGTKTRTRC